MIILLLSSSLFDPVSRYTYHPDTGAVYGALTQKYQFAVMLGNIKLGSGSKISLLGYDGDVS